LFKDWNDYEKRKEKLSFLLDLMQKYHIRKKIATETEEAIHSLMNFIRNHKTQNIEEKEEMIKTLNKLMVSVED